MKRIFIALIIGAVVVAAAWYLAGIGGQVSVTVGAWDIQTSVPVAALALLVALAVTIIVLRLLVGIWLIPGSTARWRRRRAHAGGAEGAEPGAGGPGRRRAGAGSAVGLSRPAAAGG